jgi:ribonuclease T1
MLAATCAAARGRNGQSGEDRSGLKGIGKLARQRLRADAGSLVSPPCAILLIDAGISQAAIESFTILCVASRRYNAPMNFRSHSDFLGAAMLAIIALLACLAAPLAAARTPPVPTEIRFDALPAEARDALERIGTGAPLPYERDGVVFGNRERLLPPRPRGYYHEYTVKTPGVRTRGARRIVCGGAIASTSECYYSDDHYRSFKRIRQ